MVIKLIFNLNLYFRKMNWIINSCRKSGLNNEEKMLDKNVFFIGFGTPNEKREEKKSYTTIKQFENFKKKSNIGDTIYLYANKVGIIAKGNYIGSICEPIKKNEKAPDWSELEKQSHVGVDKWIIFDTPINYKARPQTLYYEKREIE